MPNNNINSKWLDLLFGLNGFGQIASPRGMQTKELIAYQSVIDMNNPILSNVNQGMNYKFMCGKAYWILSGSNRVKDITPFMKAIAKFSDNGITFNGAYGPKVVDQLEYIRSSFIEKGPDCRQAIINIWRENPRDSRDIPCTLSLQFLIRDNRLNCVATMRSSDAWLGWVYDTFNFSMVSAYIAIMLCSNEQFEKLELGDLFLTAGSQHLYKGNWEDARKIIERPVKYIETKPINLDYYTHPDFLLEDLRQAGMEEWDDLPVFFNQIKDLKP